jgi:ribosomal protein L6P/L9E
MSKNFSRDLKLKKNIFNLNKEKNYLKFTKDNIVVKIDIPNNISFNLIDNEENFYTIKFSLLKTNKYYKSILGTYRTIIKNYALGLEKPFVKTLSVNGLGYKIEMKEDSLHFFLNKSHKDIVNIPKIITCVQVNELVIKLSSYDKQKLGFFVAYLCNLRKYNPYTGYGVLDSDKSYFRKKVRKVETK